MTEIKNDYGLDMSKLVNQLRVKAGVMEMGERIAWGSDIALMREAADRIEALEEASEFITRTKRFWELCRDQDTIIRQLRKDLDIAEQTVKLLQVSDS